jgi:hypothetical protein
VVRLQLRETTDLRADRATDVGSRSQDLWCELIGAQSVGPRNSTSTRYCWLISYVVHLSSWPEIRVLVNYARVFDGELDLKPRQRAQYRQLNMTLPFDNYSEYFNPHPERRIACGSFIPRDEEVGSARRPFAKARESAFVPDSGTNKIRLL